MNKSLPSILKGGDKQAANMSMGKPQPLMTQIEQMGLSQNMKKNGVNADQKGFCDIFIFGHTFLQLVI